VDGVAIARGAREGRDVAVGGDGLGEDSSDGLQQVHRFDFAWGYLRGVLFDYAAGFFEGQDLGLGWGCGHGEMIVEGSGYAGARELRGLLEAPFNE
jgi:hypothetical protein